MNLHAMTLEEVKPILATMGPKELFAALRGLPTDKDGIKYGKGYETMRTYVPSRDEINGQDKFPWTVEEVVKMWSSVSSCCIFFATDPYANHAIYYKRSPIWQDLKDAQQHDLDDILTDIVARGAPVLIAATWFEGDEPPYGMMNAYHDVPELDDPVEWEIMKRLGSEFIKMEK